MSTSSSQKAQSNQTGEARKQLKEQDWQSGSGVTKRERSDLPARPGTEQTLTAAWMSPSNLDPSCSASPQCHV